MPGFLQISRFLKNLISKCSINLQTLFLQNSQLIKNSGIQTSPFLKNLISNSKCSITTYTEIFTKFVSPSSKKKLNKRYDKSGSERKSGVSQACRRYACDDSPFWISPWRRTRDWIVDGRNATAVTAIIATSLRVAAR